MFNILEELRLLNVTTDGSDDKFKIRCPYHEDTNPSCLVNTKEGGFKCFVCSAAGPVYSLLAKLRNETPAKTRTYIAQKYGVNLDKTIASIKIEQCHQAIWSEKILLDELAKRAVTAELITQYRLGCENGRITIPIPNQAGFYIDLRSYAPGAETNKFRSMKGYGGNNLFPCDQLRFDKLVIVGGEIKAIACAAVLNQHGYGCITNTTGEGNFLATWAPLLLAKPTYVVMDVDAAGRTASKKLCHMLSNSVSKIYDVLLPLDQSKLPKGGPDDFIALGGNLLRVLEECEEWKPDENLVDNLPHSVSLPQAFSAKESGKRITFRGTIDCIGQSIYHVPKTLQIVCDKQQDCCALCTKVFPSRDSTFIMHPESAFILETAGCSKTSQAFAVRDALSIPKSCSAWVHNVVDRYSVEDVRVSSDLDIHNRDVEREMLPTFIVRDEDEQNVLSNATYEFTGRTWPSPRNQEAISVVSRYSLVESALESYKVEDAEKLQIFQPIDNTVQGISDKLNKIYDDLEANVTMIFGRRDIHLAVDLTYHSPLFFHFDKKERNGWLSCLIIGDSSNGKSETITYLMNHYKLGNKVEGATATRAGVLGGLAELNGTKFVTWGRMVEQDKRLLFIDELGEDKKNNLMGEINDTRSSGFARLNMIRKAITRARTRLIVASNPPNKRAMQSYNYGVDAILDLIGAPQYIRRFDLAVIVQEGEVDSEAMCNHRPELPHVYTSDLCNELVLWAWTLKHVEFEDEQLILAKAVELTKRYSEDIPLVDKGSMRLKLARLTAALAARLYSVGEQIDTLKVLNCHVEYVCEFLDRLYSKEAFGYADYSAAKAKQNELRDPDNLLRLIQETSFPRDFVEGMRSANTIDLSVITDLMSAVDRSEAQSMLSALVRHRAVKRQGKAYYKVGQFTTYLKKWALNGVLDQKPDYMLKKDTL